MSTNNTSNGGSNNNLSARSSAPNRSSTPGMLFPEGTPFDIVPHTAYAKSASPLPGSAVSDTVRGDDSSGAGGKSGAAGVPRIRVRIRTGSEAEEEAAEALAAAEVEAKRREAAAGVIPVDPDVDYHRVLVLFRSERLPSEDVAVSNGLLRMLALRDKYLFRPKPEEWRDEAGVALDAWTGVHTKWDGGVMRVFGSPRVASGAAAAAAAAGGARELIPVPTASEFYADLQEVWTFVKGGAPKTATFRRLQLLEKKFELYQLLNTAHEDRMTTDDPADFSSVAKVDNHLHLDAAYTASHLLSFIKRKLAENGDDKVLEATSAPAKPANARGSTATATSASASASACAPARHLLTMREVFEHVGLRPDNITLDALGVGGGRHMYHRFDAFNASYNPFGQEALRDIFMSWDNPLTKGRYFAEAIREVIDLARVRNLRLEPRLTLFGKDAGEWDRLAEWVVVHGLMQDSVRYLVQVPRIYQVWRGLGKVASFDEMMANIFVPLFEATMNPASHPFLVKLLEHVVAFDSVDDESFSDPMIAANVENYPPPQWTGADAPPYSYNMYYLWANLYVLNKLRESRGLNTLLLRPHAGESGPLHHLATTFLLAHSVNHGINLNHNPTLQYLYYVANIGLSMSPISNNTLFLPLTENPFYTFFKRGLNVTLSTDDPMQFHTTREPLLEEYTVAKQFWHLTTTDLCEIARNSVCQSGWSHEDKCRMLGATYLLPGAAGNDVSFTNLPDCRPAFRHEQLCGELQFLWHSSRQAGATAVPAALGSSASAAATEAAEGAAASASSSSSSSTTDVTPNSHLRPPIELINWTSLVYARQSGYDASVALWVADRDYNMPNPETGIVPFPGRLSVRRGAFVVTSRRNLTADGLEGLWYGVDASGNTGLFPPTYGTVFHDLIVMDEAIKARVASLSEAKRV